MQTVNTRAFDVRLYESHFYCIIGNPRLIVEY